MGALGDIVFDRERRLLAGPAGQAHIEPRAVQVLTALADHIGEAVTRDQLFTLCWGSSSVGDDSLNRAIYQLRKAFAQVGSAQVMLETIPARGYSLQIAELPMEQVCALARRSWRTGMAKGDFATIADLQSVLTVSPDPSAEAWGLLALHLCRAAEYEPIDQCEDLVARCQAAAESALALDPLQPDARVALSSLRPLFGDWLEARSRLSAVLADYPEHFCARHELAVLEMATGRVSAAAPLIEGLLQDDPLAATLHYKRGFHLYCLGRHDEMDRVLDNALQTWPRHAGLWQSRSVTLAFTGRAKRALELLEDAAMRPPMPPETLEFHQLALAAIAALDAGEELRGAARIADMARQQSTAVAAIMYLSHLGLVDEAMSVCEAYFLRDGKLSVQLHHDPGVEAQINEMHRRATQLLFLPVTEPLRQHPQFLSLCERIGLADYWGQAGVQPDFLAADASG